MSATVIIAVQTVRIMLGNNNNGPQLSILVSCKALYSPDPTLQTHTHTHIFAILVSSTVVMCLTTFTSMCFPNDEFFPNYNNSVHFGNDATASFPYEVRVNPVYTHIKLRHIKT